MKTFQSTHQKTLQYLFQATENCYLTSDQLAYMLKATKPGFPSAKGSIISHSPGPTPASKPNTVRLNTPKQTKENQ